MSRHFYKTVKSILSLYLVPDVINIILEMVEREYINDALEKYKQYIKKLNQEYQDTWRFRYYDDGECGLFNRHTFYEVNDRTHPVDRDPDPRVRGGDILNFNAIPSRIVGYLPKNY